MQSRVILFSIMMMVLRMDVTSGLFFGSKSKSSSGLRASAASNETLSADSNETDSSNSTSSLDNYTEPVSNVTTDNSTNSTPNLNYTAPMPNVTNSSNSDGTNSSGIENATATHALALALAAHHALVNKTQYIPRSGPLSKEDYLRHKQQLYRLPSGGGALGAFGSNGTFPFAFGPGHHHASHSHFRLKHRYGQGGWKKGSLWKDRIIAGGGRSPYVFQKSNNTLLATFQKNNQTLIVIPTGSLTRLRGRKRHVRRHRPLLKKPKVDEKKDDSEQKG